MAAQSNQPEESTGDHLDDQGVTLRIEELRPALLAYVTSLTRSSEAAEDIVQETQVFLWTNRDDFQQGTNFKAWAYKVAYFKTMAWRRDSIRRGEVVFSEAMTQTLAAAAANHYSNEHERLEALDDCLKELTPAHQRLVMARYASSHGVLTRHANTVGKSINTIHKMVSRIRSTLRDCIQRKLSHHRP
ncbi:sigma-70 family RNA polymerase sigma factor [Sulfuriroseicoccus oceanibius]|uniref:Sigma-70 family RNA polymerase sigma factor n=1 Tax=Sulfuriroseicoccus oceanibius TaxID=2707525 RepID=A0A6B3LDS7_9BACT|nr:sigma-70 family RNA polymerase sigma factor [Sulfuriroseicoccus oceanibius]QQL44466.1 sigma-70 family RNA polymerase sigma factor [Sulfuriroseicoccus oceanibius]